MGKYVTPLQELARSPQAGQPGLPFQTLRTRDGAAEFQDSSEH